MKINLFYLRFIFGWLLYLLCSSSFAQQYTFRNYSVDEGLAQSQVYAMCEDNNGNIWFGTRGGGLSRFDGIDFTSYTTQEGLASNYIRCVLKDSSGTLWIGTDNGLSVYDGKKFSTFSASQGLGSIMVNDLVQDKSGTIWIATEKGIYKTEKDSIIPFALQGIRVSCLLQDSAGNLLAGTDDGVCHFSKANHILYTLRFGIRQGLPNNIVTALSIREAGGVWVCTYGGGVAVFDSDNFLTNNKPFSVINKSMGLASNTVFDCVDAGDAVWFVTASGITKYNADSTGASFTQITETEGLSKNVVMCTMKDSFGNLWFGTSGGGVSKLSSERFIHYTAIKGVFGTWVYAILQDSSGLMWFATSEGGVTTYDGKIYKRFSERNGFTASKIKCMAQDSSGNIWLGTISDGVYMYNGKTFRHFNNRNGLSSNFINYILVDESGRVLLATAGGGISCLLPSKNNMYAVKNIRPRDGLASDRINTLVTDRKGAVWVGTAGNGISLIRFAEDNTYTIKNYTTTNGLTSNTIRCSVADNRGGVIFGTADAGLIVYEGGKFVSVTKTHGLCSNNIYSCILDVRGSLWIGTDKGIDRMFLSSGNGIEVIRHYGKSEGFTGIEAIQNSVCLDNRGYIWFGTVKSATVFNPAAERTLQIPRVHITGMHLFFDAIEQTPYGKIITPWYALPESLLLPYDQNHLSFEFIGVEQANPEAVAYSWMLEGFDKGWTPATTKREAVYSNLPPGTYTFKVKAANEEDNWNDNAAVYTFTIRPPFWQTWWFILAAFVVFVAAVWWLIFSASRKLKKENIREKQRLEAERSLIELEQKALRLQMNPHFLFNCLNSIKGLIAEDKPEEAKIYLSKFAKLMRSMLDHSMDAFISLENEITGLRMYAELEKLSNADAFDFNIIVDETIDPSFVQIPPMMIQPFVENAILHGMAGKKGKGKISVTFTQEENYLHCVIEDDGVGRTKAAALKQQTMQQHKSAAITVTQERLNILNKKLNLEAIKISVVDLMTEEHQAIGTRVTLLIPFQQ